MKKTLLIIGASSESIPGFKKAKELGLDIIASDIDENAPALKYADYFIKASTYNAEETILKANEFHSKIRKIDGVICISNDVPLTVAKVANSLGLEGLKIQSALWSSNKLEMKKRFREKEIPIPWFKEVKSIDDLKKIVNSNPFEMVLKPIDSRGSRGVIRICNKTNLNWAFEYSKVFLHRAKQ